MIRVYALKLMLCVLTIESITTMFPIFLPRVTAHYNEFGVTQAINDVLGGDFVSHVNVRLTIYRGRPYQSMIVYFTEQEGNETTDAFFAELERRPRRIYNGGIDKREWLSQNVPNPAFGRLYYWIVQKHVPRTAEA